MRLHSGKAKTLNDKQLSQLFKMISVDNNGQRNTTIMAVSHFLGLRAKEMAALTISDVLDTSGKINDVLRLKPSYTKFGKPRDVPLSHPKLRKYLQNWIAYRQETDGMVFNRKAPLFRSQKKLRFSPSSMSRMVSRLYQKNGFTGCSSHSGRRSMITKLVNRGISINKVQIIAGHSSVECTMGYVDSDPIELSEIMKAL